MTQDQFRDYILSVDSEELAKRIGQRFYDKLRKEERHCFGADGISSARFGTDGIEIVETVKKQIVQSSKRKAVSGVPITPTRFTFTPFKKVLIEKPGSTEPRELSISSLRNIVAQSLISAFMLEKLEESFLESSYAFRQGKSAKEAVQSVYKAVQGGYHWVLDADIRKFFDSVDHVILLTAFRENFPSEDVLNHLIYRYLKTGSIPKSAVERKLRIRSKTSGYASRAQGIPQGGILSGALANLYLHPLDVLIAKEFPQSLYVRYADDFVVLGKTQAEVKRAKIVIEKFLTEELKLCLHPEKTEIIDLASTTSSGAGRYVEFLGYRIERNRLAIKKDNLLKMKERIQKITHSWIESPETVENLIWRINKRIEGFAWTAEDGIPSEFLGRNWLRYFSCITSTGQLKELDEWIIRAIKDGVRRKTGNSLSRAEIRSKGLLSLVNWHFKMIRISRNQARAKSPPIKT